MDDITILAGPENETWRIAYLADRAALGASAPAESDEYSTIALFWRGRADSFKFFNLLDTAEKIIHRYPSAKGTLQAFGSNKVSTHSSHIGLATKMWHDSRFFNLEVYRADLVSLSGEISVWVNTAEKEDKDLLIEGENIGIRISAGLYQEVRSWIAETIDRSWAFTGWRAALVLDHLWESLPVAKAEIKKNMNRY